MRSILFKGCKKKLYGITNCYDPTEIVTNKKENKTKIDVPKGNVISLGRIKINFFFGCVLIRFSVPSPGFFDTVHSTVCPAWRPSYECCGGHHNFTACKHQTFSDKKSKTATFGPHAVPETPSSFDHAARGWKIKSEKIKSFHFHTSGRLGPSSSPSLPYQSLGKPLEHKMKKAGKGTHQHESITISTSFKNYIQFTDPSVFYCPRRRRGPRVCSTVWSSDGELHYSLVPSRCTYMELGTPFLS